MDFEPRQPETTYEPVRDHEQLVEIMRALREAHHSDNAKLKDLMDSLPSMTEEELVRVNEKESSCPICLVPFTALLCEEEIASVNDSPASAKENLGVTRLSKTCGHIFCRKDIRQWIQNQNDSCPTCRTPFFAPVDNEADTTESPQQARNRAIARDLQSMFRESGVVFSSFEIPGDPDSDDAENDNEAHEFMGHYS